MKNFPFLLLSAALNVWLLLGIDPDCECDKINAAPPATTAPAAIAPPMPPPVAAEVPTGRVVSTPQPVFEIVTDAPPEPPPSMVWTVDTLSVTAARDFPKTTPEAYAALARLGVDTAALRLDVAKYLRARNWSAVHTPEILRRVFIGRYYRDLFLLASQRSGTETAFFFAYFIYECNGKTSQWVRGKNAGGLVYSKRRHPDGYLVRNDHTADGVTYAARFAKFNRLSDFARDWGNLLTARRFGGYGVNTAEQRVDWCARGNYHVVHDKAGRKSLVRFYRTFENYFTQDVASLQTCVSLRH